MQSNVSQYCLSPTALSIDEMQFSNDWNVRAQKQQKTISILDIVFVAMEMILMESFGFNFLLIYFLDWDEPIKSVALFACSFENVHLACVPLFHLTTFLLGFFDLFGLRMFLHITLSFVFCKPFYFKFNSWFRASLIISAWCFNIRTPVGNVESGHNLKLYSIYELH